MWILTAQIHANDIGDMNETLYKLHLSLPYYIQIDCHLNWTLFNIIMRFMIWAYRIQESILCSICAKTILYTRHPIQIHIYFTFKLHGRKLNIFNASIKTIYLRCRNISVAFYTYTMLWIWCEILGNQISNLISSFFFLNNHLTLTWTVQ